MIRIHSFFTRIIVGNLVLVTLILILVSVFTFQKVLKQTNQKSEVIQRELLSAHRAYLELIWKSEEHIAARDEQIQAFCLAFNNRHSRLRITVIDPQGHVIADSEEDPTQMALHTAKDRPEIAAALQGRFGKSFRNSETMNQVFRYFAEPIYWSKEKNADLIIVGVIRIAMPNSDAEEVRQTLFSGNVLIFLLVFATALFPVFMLAMYWYRPVRQLYAAARRFSQGELDTPIVIDDPVELSQLGAAMESMRQTVSEQLNTIRNQQKNFWIIFNELNEAIFAMNADDHLLFANQSAKDLFGLNSYQTEQAHLQSVLRYAAILSFYESVQKNTGGNTKRIKLKLGGQRRVLELQVAKIAASPSKEGIAGILIIRDQTTFIRTAEMKSEFVANASHELRTPLTTIRAVIDNLLDNVTDDPETTRRLINMLNQHVGRLETMVRNLLDLHIAEHDHVSHQADLVPANEIVDWLRDMFRMKTLEKGITLHINCSRMTLRTDINRLHLILQNIVDNAIKFSPPGSEITLDLSCTERQLNIVCRDHGSGIPKEELHKVFERFYQFKSEKTGDNRLRGTGLGLAIVKHATERLGGTVVLESQPDVGTTITIRLPIAPASD